MFLLQSSFSPQLFIILSPLSCLGACIFIIEATIIAALEKQVHFDTNLLKSFKPLTDSPVQSVFSKEITNPCSELSTHFFAKKVLVMLKNQYFAPTMWVHFSWRLQYKFITSHNHERVKFLLKHHRAS